MVMLEMCIGTLGAPNAVKGPSVQLPAGKGAGAKGQERPTRRPITTLSPPVLSPPGVHAEGRWVARGALHKVPPPR